MNSTRREFLKKAGIVGSVMSVETTDLYRASVRALNTGTEQGQNPGTSKRSNTDWFKDAKWGVFCHYLTGKEMTADEWNRRVDSFTTKNLADQLESVGASYFFLTIGQNSGNYYNRI